MTSTGEAITRLERWLGAAERYLRIGDDGIGWYGSGYTSWGVQTNQKYLAAAAAVARYGTTEPIRTRALETALATLRYAIHSHRIGTRACADGRPWPSTWISVLGVERAGFAIDLLVDELNAEDQQVLREVLIAEADWLTDAHERGGLAGIRAAVWNDGGENWPESNIWNGAHLWRTAERYPDAPRAEEYRERAVQFMINGVSVAADADDRSVVDGLVVADHHRGANFFDSYALDHHGYLNLGYMVICVSNAAIATLDLERAGLAVPEALGRHQAELWQRIRPCIGPDGRLIRIGGDARVRYAYCQEYLLPSLLYAERRLGDTGAPELAERVVELIGHEQDTNDDGSFYGRRLSHLAGRQPYYYTRLESDRACALAFWLHHTRSEPGSASRQPATGAPLERSAWHDHEHGFAMVRGSRRFASVSWRAHSRAQSLVLPTDRPDLAEWSLNLHPVLRFEGDGTAASATESPREQRRVLAHHVRPFEGGFASIARIAEGCALSIAEGWRRDEPVATTTSAIVALPDDATVVGLHLTVAGDLVAPVTSAHGVNLLIPDDTDDRRDREFRLERGPAGTSVRIDDRLDILALDADLEIVAHPLSDDPTLRSIGVHQIRTPSTVVPYAGDPGGILLDVAWVARVGEPGAIVAERSVDADGIHHLTVHSEGVGHRISIDPTAPPATAITVVGG